MAEAANDNASGSDQDSASSNEEEEPLDPSTSPAAALRKKRAKYKLDREEKRGLVASLEHIVTVGSAIKHANERYQTWKDSGKAGHEIRGNDETEEIPTAPLQQPKADKGTTPNNNIAPQPTRMLHAEDVRIYGRDGHTRIPWPSNNTSVSVEMRDDQQWDLEHGDTVHPLAFAEARLSEIPVPPTKRHRVDGPNLSIETTDCTVVQEEVPRAMLLRCWERAMQAASSVMHLEDTGSRKNASVESSLSHSKEPFSPDDAEAKCKHLGIELVDDKACPNCGVCFDSSRQQLEHFLGKSNQRGCCWNIIRQRQLEVIGRVLRNEAMYSCEDLIHIVVSSSLNNEVEGRGHLNNWHDVLVMLETEVASQRQYMPSSSHPDSKEPIAIQTILGSSQEAVVLNEQILEAVRMRLVERYADLPR